MAEMHKAFQLQAAGIFGLSQLVAKDLGWDVPFRDRERQESRPSLQGGIHDVSRIGIPGPDLNTNRPYL